MDSFKPENWTSSSNDCVKISLLNSTSGKISTFHPDFTYPIYGDSEQIFGYKDLEVILAFESKTFLPLINLKYSEKLDEDQLSLERADPLQTILEYLPSPDSDDLIIKDEKTWVDQFTKEIAEDIVFQNLKNNGELISRAKSTFDDGDLLVFKINISQVKNLHKRFQIYTLFFIEGASYIDDEDNDWDMYILVNGNSKEILGYTTCYKYWHYKSAAEFDLHKTPLDYQYRSKISQFIIFPPYQGKGYGSVLYNTVYQYWLTIPTIDEITVEDPNESFDVLRDKNDLQYLVENVDLNEIKSSCKSKSLTQSFPSLESLKYEPKQLKRLTEMLLQYVGKDTSSRLQIKKRLFEKNYDALIELEMPDRLDKLQTTYLTIRDDYSKVIQSIKDSQKSQKIHHLENISDKDVGKENKKVKL